MVQHSHLYSIVILSSKVESPFGFKVQGVYSDGGDVGMFPWLVSGTQAQLLAQLFLQCLPGCLDDLVLLRVVEVESSLGMYCLGACGSKVLLTGWV